MTRSGFVAVAGRPNVGKSTLVNALVGAKVAVTSDKPQTTRRAIRGIANGEREGERWQLVLVDLPGVQQPARRAHRAHAAPRRARAGRLRRRAVRAERRRAQRRRATASSREALRRRQAAGRGGREQGRPARPRGRRRRRSCRRGGARGGRASTLREIVPGLGADGVRASARCATRSSALLPEGPFYFPDGRASATSRSRCALAELVREQALQRTREEVPHSIEVQVEDIEDARRADGRARVLWVETESQKGILIGAQRQHGAGDRHGGAAGDRARARPARAPRPDRQGAPRLAPRRGLLDRLGIEAT